MTRLQIFSDYLLSHAPVLYLKMNHSGQILEVNDFAREILHVETETNFQDLLVNRDLPAILATATQSGSGPMLLNLMLVSGLPETFYFRWVIDNDSVYAFGHHNVRELEKLRRELFQLTNEMSLLTRDLQKKTVELEKLNQLKNQFLGMTAHDLRKPISVIQMYSDFVLDEAGARLTDEHREFLEKIKATSQFMNRLIADFLDVSMIESGQFDLKLDAVDLPRLLQNCLIFFQPRAKQFNLNIELKLPARIPRLIIDPNKIEQVINNLLANAIEYSQPSSRILLEAAQAESLVMISVTDWGSGIKSEDLKKLFKPFGKTTTQKTTGERSTGLGLLISRKIIEAHRGTINVVSTWGEGSTFTIKLPVTLAKQASRL